MAVQKNGPNGPFYGKCGSLVGSSWRGIDYLRSLPKKRKSGPTESEAANQTKFGFTSSWLNHVSDFASIGYANFSSKATWQNMALSWNVKNAVVEDGQNFYIEYSKVHLSDGPLQEATDPTLAITEQGDFLVSWTSVYRRKAKVTDELLFIAICPESHESLFSIGDAIRSSGTFKAAIPKKLKGRSVEVFIAFCSRDRKIASRSQYLGNVALPA